jgi:hypothetical protein
VHLAARPNLYVKLSGLGTFIRRCRRSEWQPIMETTVDVFGPHRCMFGSNFPIEKLWTTYQTLIGVVRASLRATHPPSSARSCTTSRRLSTASPFRTAHEEACMSDQNRTVDREAIAEMIYLYAEAVDVLGCHPAQPGRPDPAIDEAADLFARCLAPDAKVRLYFEGDDSPATHAPSGDPVELATFVRAYFTAYGYIGTYHLAGNIRPRFTGPDSADVTSLINSTHWLGDGRLLFAPIIYRDKAIRSDGGLWKIIERDLVVQRWWVTGGYYPNPTDPALAQP